MRIAPVVLLACASLVPVLTGACKKPEPAVVDAGAVPEPVAVDAAPTVLTALDEDAGTDAGVDAAPARRATGPGLNTNQARVKQCCSELAKAGGTDPILSSLAVQCNAFAMQLGPTSGGQAPELGPLRQLLKTSPKIPPLCQGL
jgi:hypothetical protein